MSRCGWGGVFIGDGDLCEMCRYCIDYGEMNLWVWRKYTDEEIKRNTTNNGELK